MGILEAPAPRVGVPPEEPPGSEQTRNDLRLGRGRHPGCRPDPVGGSSWSAATVLPPSKYPAVAGDYRKPPSRRVLCRET